MLIDPRKLNRTSIAINVPGWREVGLMRLLSRLVAEVIRLL